MPTKPLTFIPKNRNDALALEIAEIFDDLKLLPLYQQLITIHGFELINRAFRVAMQVPAHKITASRRALFRFLIKKYAKG